jgi:hypothetical protein
MLPAAADSAAARNGKHAHAADGGLGAGPAMQSWHAECVTRFSVIADVSSDNLTAVRPVLLQVVNSAAVIETADGLRVQGFMDGDDARDVNRQLLSALRRAEKKTRLRAEWTADGYVHRFFDYVPKSTRPMP